MLIFCKVAVIPKTANILNKFDPITFPRIISNSFFLIATSEVDNSGAEVPKATIVNPIIVLLTPK